ncbi:MAG: DUF3524 domain-containing protein [Actinobacteria bacterium]|nr:DUF3524 domain-containing protein [Actinomycetota bacterium]
MRVLLVEPYFTGSHRQWAEGLAGHSAHDVRLLTHEGQFWKWRLGGGHVTLAEQAAAAVGEDGPPDLVLATSMLDLAGFLGLAREALGGVPVALYLHENQVTYPETGRTRAERALGMVTWTSLLAADGVAFNSAFHRDAVLGALPGFLGAAPDRHHGHLVERVAAKSTVVPVGVDLARIGPLRGRHGPATFLWNHRWDPDKAIGDALAALTAVAEQGLDLRVVLAGESFVAQPDAHREAIERLGTRVVHEGHLDEGAYVEALHGADAVVVTARQEFFGVSVVEAMHAGALPVLPDRLVYPERVPPGMEGVCLYRTKRQLVERLAAIAADPGIARTRAAEVRAAVDRFDWAVAGPRTDAWLEEVRASHRRGRRRRVR